MKFTQLQKPGVPALSGRNYWTTHAARLYISGNLYRWIRVRRAGAFQNQNGQIDFAHDFILPFCTVICLNNSIGTKKRATWSKSSLLVQFPFPCP